MKATLPKLTESEFQSQIIKLARLCGWRLHHQRPGRTKHGWRNSIIGDPGFPDLVLAKMQADGTARMLALECKSETGQPTPAQLAWLKVLNAVPGCVARVVRPSDFEWVQRQLMVG